MIRFLLLFFLLCLPARAQQQVRGQADATLPTTNSSVKITTGLTYQSVLAASNTRHSLTIQNNAVSGTDYCYVLFGASITSQVTSGSTTTSSNLTVAGATITAAQASITLSIGQSWTRYWPDVPGETIFATCTTTADSLYVDVQ